MATNDKNIMTNLVGQTLNNYQIIELLGGGGMAQVYKAYHPGLDVYRAIKVIRPEFVNQPGFKERFQREAQAVAKLRHPNIVQAHDYGVQDNLFFMVMEFIEGQDLKDYLKQHGSIRPFSEIAHIIEQVAAALHYAHQAGVLHRDIKPANIMLTANKQAILTDFGIAKILQREPAGEQTEAGVSIGTPAYMSPEQARGLPDIGPTADLYSLGIVLYEMLTGRVPYIADTPLAVILKVVNDPLPPPRTFSPDIPDVLQGVALKATAKNPAQRYQTGEAFIDGLKRSLSPTATDAPIPVATVAPPPAVAPPQQPPLMSKKMAWLVGGAFAVLIMLCAIVTIGDAILFFWPTPAPSLATWQFVVDASSGMNEPLEGKTKIDIARAALAKELRILPENVNAGLRVFGGQTSGRTACEDTKLLVEPAIRRSQNITSALAKVIPKGEAPLTEAIVQTIGDFDLTSDTKNTLIVITAGLDTCEADAITQLQTLTRRLGIEFDLHLIGLGVKDPTQSQQLEHLAQAAGGDYYAADNEEDVGRVLHDQISLLQGTPVAARPSPTPTPVSPTNTPPPPTSTPVPTPVPPQPLPASPFGRVAFISRKDGNEEIYLANGDGSGITNLTNSPARDRSPSWSPDGGRLAFVSTRDKNSEIYVVDGGGLTNLTNQPFDDWDPGWSPDGQHLIFTSVRDANDEIYIMNPDGSGLTNLTNNPDDDWNPTWSPDGQHIAFASNRDGNNEIYVMNPDGSGLINLTKHPSKDNDVFSWSPDSQHIAFETEERDGNEEIYVMKVDGSGAINLSNNPNKDQWPSWSPDGQRITFTSVRNDNGYQVYVINVDGSGLTQLTTKNNQGNDRSVWSPDGNHLLFESYRNDGPEEIYIMSPDGSGQMRLTNREGADRPCAWSPDSQHIAFEFGTPGGSSKWDIFLMNADGSGQVNLTNSPTQNEDCRDLVWAP